MPEFLTTLVSYTPQQVNRQDGTSFVLHKLHDTQGTEMVARADVANVAKGMLHQPVIVTVRTEQKGRYTNTYLDFVRIADGMVNPAMQAAQAQQQYQPQATTGYVQTQPIPPPQPPPPVPQPPQPPQQQGLSEKDKQIHRQVAAKVAAGLSTTPSEFWRNCVDLSYYFDTGQVPANTSGYQSEEQQRDQQYERPPVDDDIPF